MDMLLHYTAQDHLRLHQEIEKLALLDMSTLEKKDIEKYITETPEGKLFKTLEMLGSSPFPAFIKQLENLLREEDSGMVFFMIVRQFRLLLQIRYGMDRKIPGQILLKRLKLAPFQGSALTVQARHFSLETLKKIIGDLAQLDFEIKTGKLPLSSHENSIFLLRLCQMLESRIGVRY